MKIHPQPKLPSNVPRFPLTLGQTGRAAGKASVALEAVVYRKEFSLNSGMTPLGQGHILFRSMWGLRFIKGRACSGTCSRSHGLTGSLSKMCYILLGYANSHFVSALELNEL